MEGTTAGALIPEIVRRGFQDLLEAEVSAVIGTQQQERCPNVAAIIVRLVGSQLQEQQEDWQLEQRSFFSEATMAKIPEPEEPLDLPAGNQAESAAAVAS